jgi:hypothetical protein
VFLNLVNSVSSCMDVEGERIVVSANLEAKSMLAQKHLQQDEACKVPDSTVNSLVGSACDSMGPTDSSQNNKANDETDLATVPSNSKSNLILGKLYSTGGDTAGESSGQPKKNLIQENIERIKEHVNNSDNYARTEIEQVHRPCGVHTIGRQITSSVNKEAEIVKKDLNVERGLVSRAKEG